MVAPRSMETHSALETPTSGEAIIVRGLEKSFGEWPVLWNRDLTVRWGAVVALFGGNGVG